MLKYKLLRIYSNFYYLNAIKKPTCLVCDLDDVTPRQLGSPTLRIRGFPSPPLDGFGLLVSAQFSVIGYPYVSSFWAMFYPLLNPRVTARIQIRIQRLYRVLRPWFGVNALMSCFRKDSVR